MNKSMPPHDVVDLALRRQCYGLQFDLVQHHCEGAVLPFRVKLPWAEKWNPWIAGCEKLRQMSAPEGTLIEVYEIEPANVP